MTASRDHAPNTSAATPESAAPDAELIALLVAAYDTLEELSPDPEFEEPDEDLDDWLAQADAALKRHTGQSARDLVDARNAAWRNALRSLS